MRAITAVLLVALVALATLAPSASAADAQTLSASSQRRRLQTIGQHKPQHMSSGTGTYVGDMVNKLQRTHQDNVAKIEDATRAAQASVQAAHDANMQEIADTTAKVALSHDEARDRTLQLMSSAEERFSAAMTAAIAALSNAAEAWRDHLRESSARYKARVEQFQDRQLSNVGKIAGVAAGVKDFGRQKVDEAYDAHRQRVASMVSEIGDKLGDTADKLTGGHSGRRLLDGHEDGEDEDEDQLWPNFRMNQEPFERVRKGWSSWGKHRRDRWKKHHQPVSSGTGTLVGDALHNMRKNNQVSSGTGTLIGDHLHNMRKNNNMHHGQVSSGTGTLVGDALHNIRRNARSDDDDK